MQRYVNFIASTTSTSSTLMVLSNATCTVYVAGTSTAATLYSDNGITPLANPFLSSSTGQVAFYAANGLYDLVVSKIGYLTVTISAIELDDLLAPSGSNSVGYLPAGTGAVATTVQTKLRESVSVKDFGAVGNGTTDDSAAINAAIASNRNIYFPAGTYFIASSIRVNTKSNVMLQGAGVDVAIIKCSPSATFTLPALDILSSTSVSVNGLTIDSNSNSSLNSRAVVLFLVCTDTAFSDSKILHSYIGIGINSCTRFRVERNYLRKNAIATTVNYNINVSSNVSVSTQGEINDNFCLNSGSGIRGNQINISRNQFINYSYGAGIATFGVSLAPIAGFFGNYYVSDNTCHNGTQRDSDGHMVAGMEIAGPYSRIENNTISSNAGEGIRLFAYQSICTGNIVFDNGTGLDGTFHQAGITAQDQTLYPFSSASYSLISGNRCLTVVAALRRMGITNSK